MLVVRVTAGRGAERGRGGAMGTRGGDERCWLCASPEPLAGRATCSCGMVLLICLGGRGGRKGAGEGGGGWVGG